MKSVYANRTTRARYLAAVERLLPLVGVAGLRVRDIATEARLSRGGLHYNFGSVEGLVDEAARRFAETALEELRMAYSAPASDIARLAAGVTQPSDARLWTLFEFIAVSRRRPKVRTATDGLWRSWADLVRDEFAQTEAASHGVVALTVGAWQQRLLGIRTDVGMAFDRLLSTGVVR